MRLLEPKKHWRTALALICLLHFWMAISGTERVGVTADETFHLTAGQTYWSQQDYRLQPENGLFPQRLAGLPLFFSSSVELPDLSEPDIKAEWNAAMVGQLGRRFLFESGNDTERILLLGRAMIALLGAATVALIGLWSRSLFGPLPGVTCAACAAFSPSILAHSGLATSDMAGVLGFLAATAAWWRLCHRISIGRILLAGSSLGLLALSKYSAALFGPIIVALLLIRLARPAGLPVRVPGIAHRMHRGLARAFPLVLASGAALLICWGLIWAAYGFRFSAAAPRQGETFAFPWEETLIRQSHDRCLYMADGATQGRIAHVSAGVVQRFVDTAARNHLLPEAWLYGLAFVDNVSRYRPAFLCGEWESVGWWWFFPFALLVKSTPVELLLFVFGVGAWLVLIRVSVPGRRLAYKCAAPLLAALVYAAFALNSHLNIGHRHILPLYGFGFILAGLVFHRLQKKTSAAFSLIVIAALIGGQLFASLTVRPHYLTYFNRITGGPDQGYKYLVDSSLDWGQSLPDLTAWLETNARGKRVYLSYFGSDSPARFGLDATRIGDVFFHPSPAMSTVIPPYLPGVYVFSATMWQRVNTLVRGPWRPGYEKSYQDLRRFWLEEPAPLLDGFTRYTTDGRESRQRLIRYEQLCFGRIIHSLRDRKPDAIVASTQLVFFLNENDLKTALFGGLDGLDSFSSGAYQTKSPP